MDPELQSQRVELVGVFGASLVQVLDILKDNAVDKLSEACISPPWLIFREDLNVWFPYIRREGPEIAQNAQLTW